MEYEEQNEFCLNRFLHDCASGQNTNNQYSFRNYYYPKIKYGIIVINREEGGNHQENNPKIPFLKFEGAKCWRLRFFGAL